jgi:hypothetical protein
MGLLGLGPQLVEGACDGLSGRDEKPISLVRCGAYLSETEIHQRLQHFYASRQVRRSVIEPWQKVAMEVNVLRHVNFRR